MKKFLLGSLITGMSLVVVTLVSAQTTETSSSSTVSCPDTNLLYGKVNEACIGGHVTSYYDDNKCLQYKCVMGEVDTCAETKLYNEKVKLTCNAVPMEVKDAKGCLWLRCPPPVSVSSEKPKPAISDECQTLYEKLKLLKVGSADYMALKQQITTRCGNQAKTTASSHVACWRNGCTVKCDDGEIYNICLKEKDCPHPASTPVQSAATSVCKRTKDGNCWIVKCGTKVERKCPVNSSTK